jgi:hypothetical protein
MKKLLLLVPALVLAGALFTPASAQEEPCVEQASFVHTGAISGTVTAVSETNGELCTPLLVNSAVFTFDSGDGDPLFPQTLASESVVSVTHTNTPVAYGASTQCGQVDIYAEFEGGPSVHPSATLTGPDNPYEPSFLNQKSSGPSPTYFTATEGCSIPTATATPTPPPDDDSEAGTPTPTPAPEPTWTPTWTPNPQVVWTSTWEAKPNPAVPAIGESPRYSTAFTGPRDVPWELALSLLVMGLFLLGMARYLVRDQDR